MRHVDDAHDAESDGKADGGKQQDGAERQAVPDVLHRIPELQLFLNAGNGGCNIGLKAVID